MKIIRLSNVYKAITLVPRIFPNDGDIIVVKLRDELTNVDSIINHNWNYQNNYFTVELGVPEVGEDFYQLYHRYEITILRDSVIIYRGKLEFIGDDDSKQDFSTAKITNTNIIKF